MVKRKGFVSNSSSSSFFILKKNLTDLQREMIRNHIEYAKIFNRIVVDIGNYYKDDDEEKCDYWIDSMKFSEEESDQWEIEKTDESISGSTIIDNFEMRKYFEYIGIDDKIVKWGD